MDTPSFESQRVSKLLPDIIKESTASDLRKLLDGQEFDAAGIQFYAFRRLFSFANAALHKNQPFNFRSPPWNTDSDIDCRLSQLIENLSNNVPSLLSLAIIAPYFEPKSDTKTYVVQKDFFDMFKKVDLDDLQMQHLPNDICGFMALPSTMTDSKGTEFDGFFFYAGPVAKIFDRTGLDIEGPKYPHTDHCIAFAYIGKENLSVNYVIRRRSIDEFMNVADTFDETTFIDGSLTNAIPIDGYPEHAKAMFNLLAYLKSGDPDIRSFKNRISYANKQKGTAIQKDAHLSKADLVIVGWNYKKTPYYQRGQWTVESHMRKQRVGPGRTSIKLVLINEQQRSRRAQVHHDKPIHEDAS